MVNEATLIIEKELPTDFTVANATAISKGAVLAMTDPLTAILSSGRRDTVAGILAEEKVASDGRTKMPVYRGGIFKGTLSGSATVGDPLSTESGSLNQLRSAVADIGSNLSGSRIIGIAMETGADGDTILFELRPTGWGVT